MMYVFVVGPVAVTSEHFETIEPDGSHEYGTRIQSCVGSDTTS